MPRYIDAEPLKSDIKPVQRIINKNTSVGIGPPNIEDIKRIIDNQPTADVQEIRHGKWIKERFDSESGEFYHTCANCNMELVETYSDNYCANCGAIMDQVTLSSLFENYDEDYTPEEVDWGKPAGKEIW